MMRAFLGQMLVPKNLPLVKEVEKLSPRVIRVLGMNPGSFTLQGTNTYIVGEGPKRWLIDSGEGRAEYRNLLENICTSEKIQGLHGILLTHYHNDHVGGVTDVLRLFGDVPVFKLPPNMTEAQLSDSSASAEGDQAASVKFNFTFEHIRDQQVFSSAGATLKAVYTPGHTSDHVAFFLDEEKAIFSGDCVLGSGTCVFTCLSSYMRSLEILRELNPDRIYPGHGPVVDHAQDKILEYITHRQQREKQIIEALQRFPEGLSSMKLVTDIYVDLGVHLKTAAQNNIKLHLRKLEKEGAVRSIPVSGLSVPVLNDDRWVLVKQ
eukprot:TRINITY_DN19484_c0_g1::TRINITY_DN19484_c0_g1_i1::g.17176::m.17176 TRINITY_DN19484_c0_g1::TRINITY_DN19484_c0_g1_i1::g.17176  ORF type:complete len:320 (-),score=20.63,sp/Q1LZ83/LACB2_BOVIN/45.10/5e-76,Lactamase_B/PF00753.22/7.6e-21,Lactamase_B_2/PF12706.2/1.7e-07,HTH_20/PF12840.2/3.8e+03,HTH_20/PF12840.2/0.24 TRINITY_DN19484_c0_g1_i1:255-1214(-)